ncbi:MAG TPA: hypothetical protein VGB48_04930 [Allosphingosinicella sp.]
MSGDRGDAARAEFRRCFNMDAINVRCRRHNVTLFGYGPFEAALDLRGSEGQSGFNYVTLWHDEDQRALYPILVDLHQAGWRSCHTGSEQAGDQAIFTRPGAPVLFSIDISYFGNRRLRIFPAGTPQKLSGPCVADDSLGIFGLNVRRGRAPATAAPAPKP